MTREEWLFLLLIVINTAIAAVYLFLGWLLRSDEEGKQYYVMKAIVMALCPLAGPLFIFVGYCHYRIWMHRPVDLSDVVFNKEKRRSIVHADEESEKNMVPLEEAIAVTDSDNLRKYMLQVLKGNVKQSLAAIALALDSEDSETSHYAASVLQDELNTFRTNVQKIYEETRPEETEEGEQYGEEQFRYCGLLLEYLNPVLEQKIFTPIEQVPFVRMMDEVTEILYEHAGEKLTALFCEWTGIRLLDIKDFERCELWGKRSMERFPGELSSYTILLKLYFTMNRGEDFSRVLDELKQSHIVIDSETLELIRIFS